MADYITKGEQIFVVEKGVLSPLSADDFVNLANWYADELKGARDHNKPWPQETAESFALLTLCEAMAYWPTMRTVFPNLNPRTTLAFTCRDGQVTDSGGFIIPRHLRPDMARQIAMAFLGNIQDHNYGHALTGLILATDLHAAMRESMGRTVAK